MEDCAILEDGEDEGEEEGGEVGDGAGEVVEESDDGKADKSEIDDIIFRTCTHTGLLLRPVDLVDCLFEDSFFR